MKKSLTAKLFTFVLLIFLVQILIQQAFQVYFLDDYYQKQKFIEVHESLEKVKTDFEATTDLLEQVSILEDYMYSTNEPILVVKDSYGFMSFHSATNVVAYENSIIVDVDNKLYSVGQYDYVDYNDFNSIQYGDNVVVEGIKKDDDFTPIYVSVANAIIGDIVSENSIIDMNKDYFLEDEENSLENKYVQKEGKIIDYRTVFLNEEIRKKIEVLTEYVYNMTDNLGNYQFLSDTLNVNGEKLTVFTMLSLQPINEVIEIQSKFQWYLTACMLLLILLVSLIFSKIVSKPIINVTKHASEIAQLNFDVICDESREDEIGLLGKSVNRISKSLKEKIDTLENEIAFEKRQEKIRKEFVADVSHELKTPLGIIKSYSEGIQDGISKEKEEKYLSVIVEEVDKMNVLVRDMLELSNLDALESLTLERINIKRLLQNLLRPYEEVKDVKLSVQLDDCFQYVDVKRMTLAINNLLLNAYRYVDDQKIVRVILNDSILVIENSHELLSDEDLSKLWDRFYRVEKSRSKNFGGNGLGLSIVKKTLDLHGISHNICNSDVGFRFEIRF